MKKIRKVSGVVTLSSCVLFAFLGFAVPAWAQAQQGGMEPPPAESAQGVFRSAGEATTKVGTALKSGGSEVVQQGRGLWQEVMVVLILFLKDVS